jgi:GTP cyclohydrolase IA
MEKAVSYMTKVLEELGVFDIEGMEEHFEETPKRIVKAWKEFLVNVKSEPDIKVFDNPGYNDIQLCRDIDINSICAHHFFPFIGICHIAYLPKDKIIGLSKLSRIAKHFAKQPQIQERLVQNIADFLMDSLEPQGCAVIVIARHQCSACRGVESNSIFVDSAVRGVFLDDISLKQEFYEMLKISQSGTV